MKRSVLKGKVNKARKAVTKAQDLLEDAIEELNKARDEFDDDGFYATVESAVEAINSVVEGDGGDGGLVEVNRYLDEEATELMESLDCE